MVEALVVTGVSQMEERPAQDRHEDRDRIDGDPGDSQRGVPVSGEQLGDLISDLVGADLLSKSAGQPHESGDHRSPAQEEDQPGWQHQCSLLSVGLIRNQSDAPGEPQDDGHVDQRQNDPGHYAAGREYGDSPQDRPQAQEDEQNFTRSPKVLERVTKGSLPSPGARIRLRHRIDSSPENRGAIRRSPRRHGS